MKQDSSNIKSNIVNDKNYHEYALKTLSIISSCIKQSLGYYGSSSIIEDKMVNHIVTKDGLTIMKSIKFDNPISNTILDIVKKVSRELVETVGDGSTSSVVIADNLFNMLNKSEILKDYSSKEIMVNLKEIQNMLLKEIQKIAVPINDDNFDVIRKIATISNNNDEIVGNNIYEIYKDIKTEGFIYLEDSYDEEDHIVKIEGIEFSSGMVADDFSTNKNKVEGKFKNPFIFMCNDVLDSKDLNFMVDTIGNLVSRFTKPVVIIAKSFSNEFVNCWLINKKQNPNLEICLVDFAMTQSGKHIFEDIACYTGATIYDKLHEDSSKLEDVYKMLGSCDEMQITNKTTRIIGRNCSDEDIKARIDAITEQIEEYKLAEESKGKEIFLFNLEKRRANLNSKIVKYLVGGNSQLEIESRKYLIDDSILACKSALESGFVMGGNLTIPRIFYNMNENNKNFSNIQKELINIINCSFIDCFKEVIRNKLKKASDEDISRIINNCICENNIYNIKNNSYENILDTNVLNSAMTEIKILESTISIIGLIATSNQFISKTVFE